MFLAYVSFKHTMHKLGRSSNLIRPEPPPLPEGRLIFERKFPASTEEKNVTLNQMLERLQPWLERLQTRGVSLERVRLCLDEALVNAVMHGSKYDPSKQVHAAVYATEQKFSILIEDEGPGFNEEDLPDPEAPENLLEESGRGVILIRALMNEVSYWRNGASLMMAHYMPGTTIQNRTDHA